eukprot:5296714-Prymnesium_polylepis.1
MAKMGAQNRTSALRPCRSDHVDHAVLALELERRRRVAAEQQRRADDGDGRHGHREAGEHRRDLDEEVRVEGARGDGDADDVVADGPEEVELDPPHHDRREVERRHDVVQHRLHQHDVGRLDGHVRPARACPSARPTHPPSQLSRSDS